MDTDSIFGIAIIACGVLLLSYLTFRSRKAIDTIADKRLDSLRDILKEIHHGG